MKLALRFYLPSIIAATCIVYLNSFRGVFQFDDYNVIVYSQTVHSFAAWLTDLSRGIRPVLKFTYMVNWTSGSGVFWFHLSNLFIHIFNSMLVYFLAVKLTRRYPVPERDGANFPLIAALLFALHPVQTEAVTYISGRSSSLMTLLYLGSLLAYIQGMGGKKYVLVFLVSPLLFLCAVLTKETAVTLPLALFLWERTGGERRRVWHVLKAQTVHWVMVLVIFMVILAHPNYGSLLEHGFDLRTMGDNLLTQVNGVTYLLSRLVMVHRLNIDPDLPVISVWTYALALKTGLLLALVVTGMAALKRMPLLAFGLLWFFLHLMVTNSLMPRDDVANERQLYLPLVGVCLLAGAGIALVCDALKKRDGYVQAGVATLLLLLGSFTVARNHVYRSEVALWEDTLRNSPQKARVYNNLGSAYAFAGRKGDAKAAYLSALDLKPDYLLARRNLEFISRPGPTPGQEAERTSGADLRR